MTTLLGDRKLMTVYVWALLTVILPMTAAAASGDITKGRALMTIEKCFDCHDKAETSRKPAVPFIRGQHQKYLAKQMMNFRDMDPVLSGGYKLSERHSRNMTIPSANLSEDDIKNIAAYLSESSCRSFPAERRDRKVKPPARSKIINACELCHGAKGRSPFILYPKIAGQNEHYLIRQMKIFRYSGNNPEKKNIRFHRTMASHAINMSDAEIKNVSAYFAAQNCQ